MFLGAWDKDCVWLSLAEPMTTGCEASSAAGRFWDKLMPEGPLKSISGVALSRDIFGRFFGDGLQTSESESGNIRDIPADPVRSLQCDPDASPWSPLGGEERAQ